MTVTVEFVSAESLAKASADLRAMAEEQKRPLPRLVELAMATHNVALEKDPTLLSSFAWAAAVDAVVEECAKIAEAKQGALSASAYRDEVGIRVEDLNRAQTACEIAFEIRSLKSSPEHGEMVIAEVILSKGN